MLHGVSLDVWMNLRANFPNMEVLKTVLLSPASHNCLLKHNVGPEGCPQHCCAWLRAACSFPECASAVIPKEVNNIGRDSISYVEPLIESIMGGLEGLINILDSEGGFGSLEMQLSLEQAALRLNHATRAKAVQACQSVCYFPSLFKYTVGVPQLQLIFGSTKTGLKLVMQMLTSLCSVLNDMEPICVLNHVFVLRRVCTIYVSLFLDLCYPTVRRLITSSFSRKSGCLIQLVSNLKFLFFFSTFSIVSNTGGL